jgi:hypothetical protein
MQMTALREYIRAYKVSLDWIHEREIYKWRAVKNFQDSWQADAPDFYAMLSSALQRTGNLLQSGNYYPRRMLLKNTAQNPEEIRSAFLGLFDDQDSDLLSRIERFRAAIAAVSQRNYPSKSHYQDDRAVVAYLSLRFPERYLFYKFEMFNGLCERLEIKFVPRRGNPANVERFLQAAELIRTEIRADAQLMDMHRRRLRANDYRDENATLITQDVIYAITRYLSVKPTAGGGFRSMSADDYRQALLQIERSITDQQRTMLRAHYYAHEHCASLRQLALAAGYDDHRVASSQYNSLSANLAKPLAFDTSGDQMLVLATILAEKDSEGYSVWQMEWECAEALEKLGWVHFDPPEESADSDDEEIGKDAKETERNALRSARIGQGEFRSGVAATWNGCAVTGCSEMAILIASHIVPWKEATNAERLDPSNGLMLIPNLDRLFDRWLISFDEAGRVLISKHLKSETLAALGVSGKEKLRYSPSKVSQYMKLHRATFERKERKRA